MFLLFLLGAGILLAVGTCIAVVIACVVVVIDVLDRSL
jgi:hypothetical protein